MWATTPSDDPCQIANLTFDLHNFFYSLFIVSTSHQTFLPRVILAALIETTDFRMQICPSDSHPSGGFPVSDFRAQYFAVRNTCSLNLQFYPRTNTGPEEQTF